MIEWRWLAAIAVMVLGSGLFLRLVAKEARRRENYLKIRLEWEQHEARLEANRRKFEEEGMSRRKRRHAQAEPEGESAPSRAEPTT